MSSGWLPGICGLLILLGCVPQPVYTSREGRLPDSAQERNPRSGSKLSAHPFDPAKLDIKSAYQLGIASFYGDKFHGKQTASGEVFNMYKLTAAHRVLPLGTWIRVTSLENGRWVEVKVNDRGPFVEGRILDLSFAAALELEMVSAGLVRVMVEIVKTVE